VSVLVMHASKVYVNGTKLVCVWHYIERLE